MTRDEMINALIVDMMNTIREGDDGWYLSSICENGFIGFINYTDEELAQEYAEIFENNQLAQG
jgi:hypothetical protein